MSLIQTAAQPKLLDIQGAGLTAPLRKMSAPVPDPESLEDNEAKRE